jgi:hypothetical protein
MGKFSRITQAVLVFGISGVLSTALEFVQAFLPRHPSFADIACNIGGAMVGLLINRGWFTDMHVRLFKTLSRAPRTVASTLVIYGVLLFAAFALPLPLSCDFTGWSSEFDVFLGNEWDGRLPWQGTIMQLSLFDRELTTDEVQANFLKGYSRDSAVMKREQGLLFYHDFAPMPRQATYRLSQYALPIRLRVNDPSRVRPLLTQGLAVQNTSLTISAMPSIHPTGHAFFPHYEFSAEVWLAPADRARESTARLISYSREADYATFSLAQNKVEIAFDLKALDTDSNAIDDRSGDGILGPPVRHVVVTYRDGVQRLYTDGKGHARELRQMRNALSDTVIELVGLHFKWPLCAVVISLSAVLIYVVQVSRRSLVAAWTSFVTAFLPAAFIAGIRVLTLKAPADPWFIIVASGGVLSAIACASSIHRINQASCDGRW